jgi:hypothetical protein
MQYDWVQASVDLYTNVQTNHRWCLFRVQETKRKSMHYKFNSDIEINRQGEWRKFAEIQYQPYVSFISDKNAQIKVSNEWLYCSEWFELFMELLREADASFKHWSRLDAAIDFQQFEKTDLIPEQFLHGIQTGEITVRMKRKSEDSANRYSNIAGLERLTMAGKKYSGISFGSYRSSIMVRMYNKTLEMRQKTNKPYIYAQWQGAGFDLEKDVWRIEFTLKKDNKALVDTDTGEVLADFKRKDIARPANLPTLMRSLFEKKLQVAHTNGKKQFCRMERFELFNIDGQIFAIKAVSEYKNSSNYDKYRIKHLIRQYHEIKELNPTVAASLQYTLLNEVADRNLEDWYEKIWEQKEFRHLEKIVANYDYDNLHKMTMSAFSQVASVAYTDAIFAEMQERQKMISLN